MKKSKTKRGFRIYTFKDFYGEECSLQKSSMATQPQVWLGLHAKEIKIHQHTGESLGMRMLIDRKLAKELAVKLLIFSETGEI